MDSKHNGVPQREQRLDAVVAAYLQAVEAGQQPDRQELLVRHADLLPELGQFFEDADALGGLALRSRSVKPAAAIAGPSISETITEGKELGDFRILREVGKGGMGIVYEAEQLSLRRRVALKVLPFAATMDPRHLQRFHNEAQAAACLHHANIVPVYFVGCERSVHFYAMQFIEGQSLAELIAVQSRDLASGACQRPGDCYRGVDTPRSPDAVTLPIAIAITQTSPRDAAHYRRIAQWGIQAAEALEHAHSLGIVHRDIKPANLMIDARGVLWITDFGLARTTTDAGLTMTGDVLGTLRYMSPEQALAKHGLVDHRSDIYALGATLYELLTLRPAIDGKDREEILRKITFEEPLPPRSYDRTIPADLETIVCKALAKEPAERYATALELAEDLRRFQSHRPIQARPLRRWTRVWRWCRRNPFLAALTGLSAGLAVALLMGSIVSTWLIAGQRDEIRGQHKLTLQRERDLRSHLYASDISLAWQALREGERERMRGLLDRHVPKEEQEDLRGFEWHYLQRRSRGLLHEAAQVAAHEGGAYCVTYSPDGRTLASAGKDAVIRFWDAHTLRPKGELRSGQGEVNEVVFTPDGRSLASAGDDGTVCLWDLASARRRDILRPEGCRDEVSALAISPDGKVLVAGGKDGQIWSWDLASTTLKAKLNPGEWIHYLTFAPHGRILAVALGGRVVLLDPATLQERGQFHPYGPACCVSFSHDSGTLAAGSASAGRILLWDLTKQLQRIDLLGHEHWAIRSLSFSPDNALLASGGDDGRVRLWDVRSGSLRAAVQGHDRVWCAAFAPGGERLATAGQDGLVKLWHVLGDDRRTIGVASEAKEVFADWLTFSPDGQTLFTRTSNGELGRWSTFSGRRTEPAGVPAASMIRPALAPGCRLATVVGDKRNLRVQDLSGTAVQVYQHTQVLSAVATSSDGKRVAFADDSPALWMWEVDTGRSRELLRLSSACKCLAFAPDGGTIAVAAGAQVLLLDADRGETVAVLSGHEEEVRVIAFSPDGRLLATATWDDKRVRIWELPSGRERYCLWKHRTGVNAVAFSPDGKTLACGAGKGEVILWNVAGGQELMRLDDHRGWIFALAFSPDGKILAAAGNGTDANSAEVTLWYSDGVRPSQGP